MSVQEARKVAVTMSKESFVPPPRRIDDILSVLEQPGKFDSEIVRKHEAGANTQPPSTSNPITFAKFYSERGSNAMMLGRYNQHYEDLHKALSYAENKDGTKRKGLDDPIYSELLQKIAVVEARHGNFIQGISYMEKSFKVQPIGIRYYALAWLYLEIGDLKAAEKIINQGISYCNEKIKPGGSDWYLLWRELLRATLLEARGQFAEAESHRRAVVDYMRQLMKNSHPMVYIFHRGKLAKNLASQGLFIDAELEARKALEEVIGLSGKAGLTAEMIEALGYILLLQGRVDEAEKILDTGIGLMQASGLSYDSMVLIKSILELCKVLVAKRNFAGAMQHYDQVKQAVKINNFYYQKNIEQSPDVIFSLIKTGRIDEALPLISKASNNYKNFFGTEHPYTAEIFALRATAYAAKGNVKDSLRDFSKSIPLLLSVRTEFENNYPKKIRLQYIIEEYLKLLGDISKNNMEQQFEIDTSAESFKLVQILIESTTHKALGATSARAASAHPELADLVRKEQDLLKHIATFQETLLNAVSIPRDQQKTGVLTELKEKTNTIRKARFALLDEIKRRFPKYSDFTDPQPISFAAIQEHLGPSEAVLTVIPTHERTYVWAIPSKGRIFFNILNLGENDIRKIVEKLRKALDPKPESFGDIPNFDLELAHYLYQQIFDPVKEGWKTASDLIIIASGPLGQLPFSVLPIKQAKLEKQKAELFSSYRKIPWLIRNVSITRQPSVFAFVMLRNLPKGDPYRKAFVGFGDPLFNREQLAQIEKKKVGPKVTLSSNKESMYVRGIRITQTGSLDSEKIITSHIGMLNRLPDTAEEIRSIAHATGADLERDIFLGKDASEHKVKTMDLTDRRIVAFATHALVPGDLDGLDQPAIALSAPSVTGSNEDGLLTMDEILKLKLNADWVILSACNTGAADGAGAEAVSGLGRAFFYAGTRAILVSMWPVETSSARKLTTGLFQYQKEDSKLTRAKALQKSMIELIDGPGFRDNDTGKTVASYAHPLFWAPFIIVGESSRDTH